MYSALKALYYKWSERDFQSVILKQELPKGFFCGQSAGHYGETVILIVTHN